MAVLHGLCLCSRLQARTFEVGPGKEFEAIGSVPWEGLAAGDTVRIHWRPEAYHEKWVICVHGEPRAPIVVSGVCGPDGQMPVIDGQNATCRPELNFPGEDRAVVKVGESNASPGVMPQCITIENLEIRGARPPFRFQGRKGEAVYRDNAASIWLEKGDGITVRNCSLQDSANGLVSSRQTRNVMVEGCEILGNGTELGIYQHNVYTESEGITFQFNHLGPLRASSYGNNLKDRSSGTVVRYNWIEGGSRLLDLVDSEYPHIHGREDYRSTFVYGNILVKLQETTNNQLCHYGGDSGNERWYRNGTLFFCNNTVISRRPYILTLLKLTSARDKAIVTNNIFWCGTPPSHIRPLSSLGAAQFGVNWWPEHLKTMFRFVGKAEGVIMEVDPVFGTEPGFRDAEAGDFRLASGSACIGLGRPLPEAMAKEHGLTAEYVPHCGRRLRPSGTVLDLGALQFDPGLPRQVESDAAWPRRDH